jgi:hypothetical protein
MIKIFIALLIGYALGIITIIAVIHYLSKKEDYQNK